MRHRGKMNPFLVVAILSFAPFYSSCLDQNSLNATSPELRVVSHDKINASTENSSLPGRVHVVHANDSVSPSNVNTTQVKSFANSKQNTEPVIINSSTTHLPSKHNSFHDALQENVSLMMNNTTKPVELQLMEGGGTLPSKSPSKKASKTTEIVEKGHNLTDIAVPSMEAHKSISSRKGAPVDMPTEMLSKLEPLRTSTTIPRPITRKMKPLFTMVVGDKFTKESESFIESPTTGKDYVLPLVLIIFAVPGFVFLVKFLYRRGTEFTERQQYHRMYLIDGDTRTSFFEKWGRVLKNLLWAENLQTVNLTNFGDVSLNPRMNYNSF